MRQLTERAFGFWEWNEVAVTRWIGDARWHRRGGLGFLDGGHWAFGVGGGGGVDVKAVMMVGFWVNDLEIEKESEGKRERAKERDRV